MSAYRIIICGQSIFLMSIEAGLAAQPEIEVERVTPCLPFDQARPERSQRAHDKPFDQTRPERSRKAHDKPFDQTRPERSRKAHDKPNLVEQLLARQPDLIVIEDNAGYGDLALALLEHGLSIVKINPNSSQVTLLIGYSYPLAELKDMIHLIERVRAYQLEDQGPEYPKITQTLPFT